MSKKLSSKTILIGITLLLCLCASLIAVFATTGNNSSANAETTTYTITCSFKPANGNSLTVQDTAVAGEKVLLNITKGNGYDYRYVRVYNTTISSYYNATGDSKNAIDVDPDTLTFIMPAGNVKIDTNFGLANKTISVESNPYGTYSMSIADTCINHPIQSGDVFAQGTGININAVPNDASYVFAGYFSYYIGANSKLTTNYKTNGTAKVTLDQNSVATTTKVYLDFASFMPDAFKALLPSGVTNVYFGTAEEYATETAGLTPADTSDATKFTSDLAVYVNGTDVYMVSKSNGDILFPNCGNMFASQVSLEKVVFGKNVDFSNVTCTNSMFSACTGLTTVEFNEPNFASLIDASSMFCYCQALGNLDISFLSTTTKLMTLQKFLYHTDLFITADISNIILSECIDYTYMFAYSGVEKVICTGCQFSSDSINAANMFSSCTSLTKIIADDAFGGVFANTQSSIFYHCEALTGGNCTTYDGENIGASYAVIDEGETQGYFTRGYAITNLSNKYAQDNGYVEISGDPCTGEEIAITAVANEGYVVGNIKVFKTDDAGTTIMLTSDNKFTMEDYDVTVQVDFVPMTEITRRTFGYTFYDSGMTQATALKIIKARFPDVTTPIYVCYKNDSGLLRYMKYSTANGIIQDWRKSISSFVSEVVPSNKVYILGTIEEGFAIYNYYFSNDYYSVSAAKSGYSVVASASGSAVPVYASICSDTSIGKPVGIKVIKHGDPSTVVYSTTVTLSDSGTSLSFVMPKYDVDITCSLLNVALPERNAITRNTAAISVASLTSVASPLTMEEQMEQEMRREMGEEIEGGNTAPALNEAVAVALNFFYKSATAGDKIVYKVLSGGAYVYALYTDGAWKTNESTYICDLAGLNLSTNNCYVLGTTTEGLAVYYDGYTDEFNNSLFAMTAAATQGSAFNVYISTPQGLHTANADGFLVYAYGDDTKTPVATVSAIAGGGFTFTMPNCAVVVEPTFIYKSFTIADATGTNGSITVATSAQYTSEVAITNITANEGYKLYQVIAYKTGTPATTVAVSSDYKFTMPGYAVTVEAQFIKDLPLNLVTSYTVDFTVNDNNMTSAEALDWVIKSMGATQSKTTYVVYGYDSTNGKCKILKNDRSSWSDITVSSRYTKSGLFYTASSTPCYIIGATVNADYLIYQDALVDAEDYYFDVSSEANAANEGDIVTLYVESYDYETEEAVENLEMLVYVYNYSEYNKNPYSATPIYTFSTLQFNDDGEYAISMPAYDIILIGETFTPLENGFATLVENVADIELENEEMEFETAEKYAKIYVENPQVGDIVVYGYGWDFFHEYQGYKYMMYWKETYTRGGQQITSYYWYSNDGSYSNIKRQQEEYNGRVFIIGTVVTGEYVTCSVADDDHNHYGCDVYTDGGFPAIAENEVATFYIYNPYTDFSTVSNILIYATDDEEKIPVATAEQGETNEYNETVYTFTMPGYAVTIEVTFTHSGVELADITSYEVSFGYGDDFSLLDVTIDTAEYRYVFEYFLEGEVTEVEKDKEYLKRANGSVKQLVNGEYEYVDGINIATFMIKSNGAVKAYIATYPDSENPTVYYFTKKVDVSITEDEQTVTYDSKAKTFELKGDDKDLDFTIKYYKASDDQEVESVVNAGSYYVIISYAGDEDYNAYTSDHIAFTVEKADYDMDDVAWNYEEAFTYDGSAKKVALTGLPTGVTATYKEDTATVVGEYTAVATLTYDTDNYNEISVDDLDWEIVRATFDMTNVAWDYEEAFTYDGSAKKVALTGLPTGVTATYKDDTATVVGEYTAVATLTYDTDNYNEISVDDLDWEIVKADYDMSNVAWYYEDAFVFANETFTVEVTGLPTGVTASYYGNSALTVGTYTAIAYLTYDTDNYNEISVDDLDWEIVKATFDMSNVAWNYEKAFTYDGSVKAVVLTGLPTGVSATYEGNSASEIGNYTAVATLIYDEADYNAISVDDLAWEIICTEVKSNSTEENSATVIIESKDGKFIVAVDVVTSAQEKEDRDVDYTPYVGDGEYLAYVCDIKLIQVIDGQEVEVQPGDVTDGPIIVKVKLPEDIDIADLVKIVHVHSADDIEEIDISKVTFTDDGFCCFEVERLSEFGFITTIPEDVAFGAKMSLIGIAAFVVIVAVVLVLSNIKNFKRKK